MRPSQILVRATAVASAALLAACAGRDIAAPDLNAANGVHRLLPSEGPSHALTADGVPIIRIGVVPSASTITLGSAADYVVTDKGTGEALLSGHAGSASVKLASVIVSYDRLQVICTGLSSRAQSLVEQARALGFVAMTDPIPGGCIRVLYGQLPAGSSAPVRQNFQDQLAASGLLHTGSWKTLGSGTTAYAVTSGGVTVQSAGPVTISSSDGVVTINGSTYRGLGEARANAAGTLAGINELPLEQYLYGVVPRELGPVQYPEMEAQKAQAIVARTYALAGLGKRASDGYDLLATTSDQVYGGFSAEHPVSNQAVDETRGRVVTYKGNLISTLYSSTSGGHTADNEEAFNGAAAPYLRGVPDAERGNAFEHVPNLDVFMSHANPKSLRAATEGDFESDWASYHRWTFEWNATEISDVVSAFAGKPVSQVLAINALQRGPSGRVLELQFVTTDDTLYAYKDGIRAALKYYNASHTAVNLPSTLFFIEPVIDRKTKQVTGFIAYGGGLGHGVGMSQTGAVGMAQKGHTVDEILHHYYQGVELESQY